VVIVWRLDVVRVVVAGQMPREAHNAPLHLFSASPDLVGFGQSAYQQRSERTSGLLRQLFQQYQGEDLVMPFTWEDFDLWYIKEHFPQLAPEAQREVLKRLSPERRRQVVQSLPAEERLAGLPAEERLAGLPAEQIRQYLDQLTGGRPAKARKPRRKRK
jgi:hypothetical protein